MCKTKKLKSNDCTFSSLKKNTIFQLFQHILPCPVLPSSSALNGFHVVTSELQESSTPEGTLILVALSSGVNWACLSDLCLSTLCNDKWQVSYLVKMPLSKSPTLFHGQNYNSLAELWSSFSDYQSYLCVEFSCKTSCFCHSECN